MKLCYTSLDLLFFKTHTFFLLSELVRHFFFMLFALLHLLFILGTIAQSIVGKTHSLL